MLMLVVGGHAIALAQTSDAIDRADAQFAEGKRLLGDGAISAACIQFAASYQLAARGGTLLNLALCHEQEGKLLLARRELQTALARARRDGRKDREPIAMEHLATVEAKLSWLEIIPPAGATDSLQVTVDGAVIDRSDWNAVPLEPGGHLIVSSAGGFHGRATTVEFGATPERRTLRLESLEPVVTATIQVPPLAEAAAPVQKTTTERPLYARPWFWGIVGAALAGVTVFAVRSDNRVEYPRSDVTATYP